ncbi:tetratricopeptide repeat protein, partial [bacterium]|nr:tetratricopeptide repeat protein [bacterium]
MYYIDRRSLRLILIFLLVVVTYIAFSQVVRHGFINLDDNVYVSGNNYVKKGLTWEGIVWAFTKPNDAGLWIPLTWLSLMLDSHFFGLNAGGYHLTNLLIHMINVSLLFLLLERLTGALWQSAFVAALFAIHPLRVESVAWVTERKDVLCALFFMLSVWSYACYVKRPGFKRYLLVFLSITLGLMAKPMLVTLPIVLLLLDYWPIGRFSFGLDHKRTGVSHPLKGAEIAVPFYGRFKTIGLILEKAPFFLLVGIFSILAISTQKRSGALAPINLIPHSARITNALFSYVRYIGKTIWPCCLAVLYPHPGMLPVWQVAVAVLFLLLISLTIWKTQRPYLIVGWLWYILTLFPVIGLIQAGPQAMADRFTYIPLIGIFIMIAWGVPDILKGFRNRRITLALLSSVALLVLIILTIHQVTYWKDSITLFEHTLDVTDKNPLIHNNLAHTLSDIGNTEDAIVHYKEAIRIRPKYVQAHYNLASVLSDIGNTEDAIVHYKE